MLPSSALPDSEKRFFQHFTAARKRAPKILLLHDRGSKQRDPTKLRDKLNRYRQLKLPFDTVRNITHNAMETVVCKKEHATFGERVSHRGLLAPETNLLPIVFIFA
jgi:hypothetical protein